MAFERGAVAPQIEILHRLLKKDDAVRIARRNRRDLKRPPQRLNRRPAHNAAAQQAGHARAVEHGLAHIHAHRDNLAALHIQQKRFDARKRLQRHGSLARHAAVVDVFANAARRVAAHRALRAVRVEHDHPEIGDVAGRDDDQAVRADAEMAVAQGPGQRRKILRMLLKAVDINVVVAKPVHLAELHRQPSVTERPWRQARQAPPSASAHPRPAGR